MQLGKAAVDSPVRFRAKVRFYIIITRGVYISVKLDLKVPFLPSVSFTCSMCVCGCDCRGTGSGVFVEVTLPVGTHNYLFIVDGEYKTDPSSPMVSTR